MILAAEPNGKLPFFQRSLQSLCESQHHRLLLLAADAGVSGIFRGAVTWVKKDFCRWGGIGELEQRGAGSGPAG